MNILTILGSPRRRGHTATVLSQFEALAQPQHAVERIDIADVQVHGCLGCDSCQRRLERPGCAQKDDFDWIIERILAADLVVYASPVYVWSVPAQLKALFDRHYCLVKWQDGKVASALMANKAVALLLTCGGDAAGNLDLPQQAFAREIEYLQARLCGTYALADVASRQDAHARGSEVAARMASELLTPAL